MQPQCISEAARRDAKTAMELVVAAQAIDLRSGVKLGVGTNSAYRHVRTRIPAVTGSNLVEPTDWSVNPTPSVTSGRPTWPRSSVTWPRTAATTGTSSR